jgi:DNA-binding NtrC family response regulator
MGAERQGDGDTTRVLTVDRDRLSFYPIRLEVVAGPDAGRSVAVEEPEVAIGSAGKNDLSLGDPAVSRHHCSIAATPEGYLLRDLGSTNGTFVGDTRILEAYIQPGTELSIGGSRLRFESGAEEVSQALSTQSRFGRALGQSAAMRRIFEILPRIAAANATVLLEGETGTGKGLLAQAIHNESPRSEEPFVVVDCGSIPPTLIESELFGHAKGAFTGAQAARAGAFEAAGRGTLFLDELGELPLDMQPKLLRALEEREVKRVGSNETVQIEARVIAATNRDLRAAVNKGTFRSDLYYRLNTIRLRVPPLRERREDIPLLVEHFYRQFADDRAAPPAELLVSLSRQDWPGNVRELRSSIERGVLMGDLDTWQELHQPGELGASPGGQSFDLRQSFRAAKEQAMNQWEKWYVRELAERHAGNLSRAARAARMDRNHLRELLQRYDIPLEELRKRDD